MINQTLTQAVLPLDTFWAIEENYARNALHALERIDFSQHMQEVAALTPGPSPVGTALTPGPSPVGTGEGGEDEPYDMLPYFRTLMEGLACL